MHRRKSWQHLERTFAEALEGEGFRPAKRAEPFDFLLEDGQIAIEVKNSTLGARDLRAQLFQLAVALRENPGISRAVLVTRMRNLRPERLHQEMHRMREVLQADLVDRLFVMAIGDDEEPVVEPRSDEFMKHLRGIARRVWAEAATMPYEHPGSLKWSTKTFQIWLTLLDAWLRDEGPLPVGTLARRAGCSQPTVAMAMDRLVDNGEVLRTSNRSAVFKSFPRSSLNEILVLADTLRPATRLVDASGRAPDPERLLRRLARYAPAHVAVGGVTAARHHNPRFDLNGTPRIDLVVHGRQSLNWLEQVDPALQPAKSREAAPILVLHTLETLAPGFDPPDAGGLPFAGPAETLLDLYDLRLVGQAEAFIDAIRRRSK